MFLKKSLLLTKAAFIWSKNTVKTVQLWNIIVICFYLNIFKNVIYSCDAMLNFHRPFELKYRYAIHLNVYFECFLSISLQQVKL